MKYKQKYNYEIKSILDNLSSDLLKKEYRGNSNPLWGHCYIATETLFHILNDEDKHNTKAMTLKVNGITHWVLKFKTGEIIDITKNQFNFSLDYNEGRCRSFLTKEPSKRTKILLNRIYNEGI